MIKTTILQNELANSLKHDICSTIFETKPTINAKTDPKIIGGIKIRIGNRVFDNSVKYQINI